MNATMVSMLLWSGAGVGTLGIVALWHALFADRSRGRRRCPKCWYDMAGVPGLTCPECGRSPRKERGLYRTRHRKRRAVVGMALVMLGAASAMSPTIHRSGWLSIVPTTVLMLFVPDVRNATFVDPATGRNVEKPIVAEFRRRTERRPLAAWQVRFLLRHAGVIRHEPSWPVDEPFHVKIEPADWLGFSIVRVGEAAGEQAFLLEPTSLDEAWSWRMRITDEIDVDWRPRVGHLKSGQRRFDLEVRVMDRRAADRPAIACVLSLPVRPSAAVDEARVVDTDTATEELRASLRPVFALRASEANADLSVLSLHVERGAFSELKGVHVAMLCELVVDGKVFCFGLAQVGKWSVASGTREVWHVRSQRVVRVIADHHQAKRVQLRLRGVNNGLLLDPAPARYWAGVIEYDLMDVIGDMAPGTHVRAPVSGATSGDPP